jgi:CysZ protein
MLLRAILAALRQLGSPPLRRILWRSIGLTLLLLLFTWILLTRGVGAFVEAHPISLDYPLLDGFVSVLTGAGLFLLLAYVMPAVSVLVAGYFLDDAALVVEQSDYPRDPAGRSLSVGTSLAYGLRFAGLSLVLNFFALILFFIPGINIAAFFAANSYLFGREYFEMAASRFHPGPEASRLRCENNAIVLAAGAVIAGFVLIPIVNLATPLFGIALMVHLHKAVAARAPRAVRGAGTGPG